MTMFYSELLIPGEVYTRAALADRFGIVDATRNTGIFRPKGSNSIWLFVTEKKTSDRTPYQDLLDGDVLKWQGQTSGRKDFQVIQNEAAGDELLVFLELPAYSLDLLNQVGKSHDSEVMI
jgi:hypothetical protein